MCIVFFEECYVEFFDVLWGNWIEYSNWWRVCGNWGSGYKGVVGDV